MAYRRSRVTALTAAMVLLVSALTYLALAGRAPQFDLRATGAAPACGDTLGPGGDFFLTEDVGTAANPCTTNPALTLNGATLDLRGHIVRSNDGGGHGIVLTGTNAVLENGTVRDAFIGVRLAGSGAHVVRGVTSKSNLSEGFNVDSSNNILRQNRASGNIDGFLLQSTNSNLLSANTAMRNAESGFEVFVSQASKLWNNTSASNGNDGYEMDPLSVENVFVGDKAIKNKQNGYDIDGDRNLFFNNLGSKNGPLDDDHGFDVDGDDNTLGSNRAIENKGSGIAVAGTGNDLVINTGKDNKGTDLTDLHGDCASNRWEGNKGRRRSPDCTGSPNASDPVEVLATPQCGDTLPPGNYFLAADLGPCDTVQSLILDSARLDLRGHTVRGDDVAGGGGVTLTGTGSILENGTVRDAGNGVQGVGEGSHIVRNITSTSNAFSGLDIEGPNNIVRNSVASKNGGDGFKLVGGAGMLMTGNTASGNGARGFNLFGGAGNALWNNGSTGNNRGYGLDPITTANTLVGNRAVKNTIEGFDVDGGGNALFTNIGTKNGRSVDDMGFFIGGDNNVLGSNKAVENGADGIRVAGTENELVTNRGVDNRELDLRDTNIDCDNNRWEGNKGTRDPACIG